MRSRRAGVSMNRLLAIGLMLWGLAMPGATQAQRCGSTCASPQSMLGMSERTLRAVLPELKRVAKPVQGPRNSIAKWALPELVYASQTFTAMFYVRSGVVSRVEYLNEASPVQCRQRQPFDLARRELAKTYGESQAAGTFENDGLSMESVSFSAPEMDVALQLTLTPATCDTRIIYKTRDIKDAREL